MKIRVHKPPLTNEKWRGLKSIPLLSNNSSNFFRFDFSLFSELSELLVGNKIFLNIFPNPLFFNPIIKKINK